MNYTSIEQSKKLLELGLSPESADMHYLIVPDKQLEMLHTGCDLRVMQEVNKEDKIFIPCWSVGALLEIIPQCHIHTPYPDENDYVCWSTHSDLIDKEDLGKSAIEALYNMVVWLLENNYINKKGDKH